MDGIAAIYSPKDNSLVHKIFMATGMVQHRGKVCSGIAVGNHKGAHVYKDMGRIGDAIPSSIMAAYQDLEPVAAIGNVGYTKNKFPERRNAEPIEIHPKKSTRYRVIATMDGYLVREDDLRDELSFGYSLDTSNKTEVIGALLHRYINESGVSFEAGKKLVDKLHGRATFAIACLVYDTKMKETYLVTLNDDKAFEPFCFGMVDGAFVASSESVSHRRLGGNITREYDGAEMTICSPTGIETRRLREEQMMPDIFQGVYFGNVASVFRGKSIFQLRKELGQGLVSHYKGSIADIVIANPDSGWGVTIGIAEALGKAAYPALVKLAQAVRTFQEDIGGQRSREVGLKFAAVDGMLEGKIVAIGDDSIVRGSVSEGGSVWVVRNAGARAIEFWVSYAPMMFPSFKEWHRGRNCLEELAAQKAFCGGNPYGKSLEEVNGAVARMIGVEKVRYNLQSIIEKASGKGSMQALDASYPIDEQFWPNWLKAEVELFQNSRR